MGTKKMGHFSGERGLYDLAEALDLLMKGMFIIKGASNLCICFQILLKQLLMSGPIECERRMMTLLGKVMMWDPIECERLVVVLSASSDSSPSPPVFSIPFGPYCNLFVLAYSASTNTLFWEIKVIAEPPGWKKNHGNDLTIILDPIEIWKVLDHIWIVLEHIELTESGPIEAIASIS
uniref:FBA_2 domain-containing protein n=2 Tax=Caenorhabditis tropicalis TaxID=1561998 RepID=A0A1I7URK7_9PELO